MSNFSRLKKIFQNKDALNTNDVIYTMFVGIAAIIVVVMLLVIGWSIGAFIVQLLWNNIICSVFVAPTITFIQAFAVNFVFSIVKGIFSLSSSIKD